jgi:hypothetical protein
MMSLNVNWPENPSTDDERATKARRTTRACLQVSAANPTKRPMLKF